MCRQMPRKNITSCGSSWNNCYFLSSLFVCCSTGQYHSPKKRLVQLAVLYGWHYQNKSKFFFLWQQHYSHPTPIPSPPPLHTETVVQFYPWSKFYFLLFQTPYHTLPYPKTYLPWQQSTLVVDSGDSLFLTSPGPLSPTVNSPNNPTTGRINKSSKQDPRVALCCSLVFIKKILKKELKKIYILKTLKRKLG